jgi:hypothetical protein
MLNSPLSPALELEEYELAFEALSKLLRKGADTLTPQELVAVASIQLRVGNVIKEARRAGRVRLSVAW